MSTRSTGRLILLLLSTLVAVGSYHFGLSLVSAAPQPPYVLIGLATIDEGGPVPAGALIEARIGNVHYGQTIDPNTALGTQDTRTHSLQSGFNYGTALTFQVCANDSGLQGIQGGSNNDPIFFFINGIAATPVVNGTPLPSLPFVTGGVQRVDLVISSLAAPTATPATASSSACSVQAATAAPTPTPTATPTPTPTATPTPAPTATPTPIASVGERGLIVMGALFAMLTLICRRAQADAGRLGAN